MVQYQRLVHSCLQATINPYEQNPGGITSKVPVLNGSTLLHKWRSELRRGLKPTLARSACLIPKRAPHYPPSPSLTLHALSHTQQSQGRFLRRGWAQLKSLKSRCWSSFYQSSPSRGMITPPPTSRVPTLVRNEYVTRIMRRATRLRQKNRSHRRRHRRPRPRHRRPSRLARVVGVGVAAALPSLRRPPV